MFTPFAVGKINADNSSFRGQKFLWKCFQCRSPKTVQLLISWVDLRAMHIPIGGAGEEAMPYILGQLTPVDWLLLTTWGDTRPNLWHYLATNKKIWLCIVKKSTGFKSTHTHTCTHLPYCSYRAQGKRDDWVQEAGVLRLILTHISAVWASGE